MLTAIYKNSYKSKQGLTVDVYATYGPHVELKAYHKALAEMRKVKGKDLIKDSNGDVLFFRAGQPKAYKYMELAVCHSKRNVVIANLHVAIKRLIK